MGRALHVMLALGIIVTRRVRGPPIPPNDTKSQHVMEIPLDEGYWD